MALDFKDHKAGASRQSSSVLSRAMAADTDQESTPELPLPKRTRDDIDDSEQARQQRRRAIAEGSIEVPTELFRNLRTLDPDAKMEDYFYEGQWDFDGLREDIALTRKYSHSDLEGELIPLREELRTVTEGMSGLEHPFQVVPGRILLSNAATARNATLLRELGVTRVVNCSPQTSKTGKGFYGPAVQYLELWMDDMGDYCVMQDFDAVWDFALGCDGDEPGACLIHCEAGVNRSGTLVVGIHMKLRASMDAMPLQNAVESLRRSWMHVARMRGRVVTNPGFQRQLLLFSRLGMRWYPTMNSLWQTPKDRNMAGFRKFAEHIAWEYAVKRHDWKHEQMWQYVVSVRDGTVHGELKLESPWDLSTKDAKNKAEGRIRWYAECALKKLDMNGAKKSEPWGR